MTDLLRQMLARPWPPVAVLMLIGAVLGYLGLGTPAAVFFMMAGMLIMVASARQGSMREDPMQQSGVREGPPRQ
jgi:hypothetical protein